MARPTPLCCGRGGVHINDPFFDRYGLNRTLEAVLTWLTPPPKGSASSRACRSSTKRRPSAPSSCALWSTLTRLSASTMDHQTPAPESLRPAERPSFDTVSTAATVGHSRPCSNTPAKWTWMRSWSSTAMASTTPRISLACWSQSWTDRLISRSVHASWRVEEAHTCRPIEGSAFV